MFFCSLLSFPSLILTEIVAALACYIVRKRPTTDMVRELVCRSTQGGDNDCRDKGDGHILKYMSSYRFIFKVKQLCGNSSFFIISSA